MVAPNSITPRSIGNPVVRVHEHCLQHTEPIGTTKRAMAVAATTPTSVPPVVPRLVPPAMSPAMRPGSQLGAWAAGPVTFIPSDASICAHSRGSSTTAGAVPLYGRRGPVLPHRVSDDLTRPMARVELWQ